MEENNKDIVYDGPYKERLVEIDNRISGLNKQRLMWAKAGGVGGSMAMQAIGEIKNLEAEKRRILDGSQLKVEELQNKIEKLKMLRAQCKVINFIKKTKLKKQIEDCENEKYNIIRRSK